MYCTLAAPHLSQGRLVYIPTRARREEMDSEDLAALYFSMGAITAGTFSFPASRGLEVAGLAVGDDDRAWLLAMQ